MEVDQVGCLFFVVVVVLFLFVVVLGAGAGGVERREWGRAKSFYMTDLQPCILFQ